MLHTSKLRCGSRNGFIPPLKRLAAALALAILLPAAASAYTVVLRSGRYVDIPAGFNVTRAGITYEYAPGLYVTIQMTSIDIPATERANNEPAGTLLSRARALAVEESSVSSPATASSGDARRTLTDKDLEAARARREESETLYERRRVELGLPSVEESRRRREAEARRLNEMEEDAQAGGAAESEAYWRTRAEELRTDIAVTDAEINYLRSKLSETNGYVPTVAFTSLTPFSFVAPVFDQTRGRRFSTATTNAPGATRSFPARAPFSSRIGFGGGSTRGRILLNTGNSYDGFSQRRLFTTGANVLPLSFYAPYSYNYGYDQGMLISRLHELEAQRAGLQARWRLLEDEARRAGAPPGWLRP